jgi:alkyl sulfatase BDS1-like metallo-beta-lactamase superfamily hydrolase
MTTRRQFVQSLPAFAVAGHMLLGEGPALAQQAAPLKGHFHPKGKAPSKFTVEVLKRAKAKLPFTDRKDFEEQKKGFIAPMKDLKIKADAGHVAWDMERFQFLEKQEELTASTPRCFANPS